MNKMKGFYVQNKQLIMLTASVVIGVFIIFAILAVIINRNGTGEEKKNNTTLNVAVTKEEKDSYTDMTTIDDGDETEIAASQDETTNEKETERETVNPKTLPYKIMVNRAANCITVYKNDGNGNFTTPVKAIVCSTGKEVGDTPLGKFSTLISYKWLRMVDDSYGQYAYRFYGSILFHSVPYYTQSKDNLEWEQFNKLGEPASLGCVRVCVADAMWLINNCQVGTAVEVYDDAYKPGPLGKPEMIKIPEDSPYRGWDPTDPDKNNPWNSCTPEIKVEKTSVTIVTHSTDIIRALGIKGYDTCGNDVTNMVKITGLDVNKEGVYTVKLNLTDLIGRRAEEVTVTVTVKNKEAGSTIENPEAGSTTENPELGSTTGNSESNSTTGNPEPDSTTEKTSDDNTGGSGEDNSSESSDDKSDTTTKGEEGSSQETTTPDSSKDGAEKDNNKNGNDDKGKS